MIRYLKKNFTRNTIIGIIGVIVYAISICLRIAPFNFPYFTTIMSDTISFASFITCLMFISLYYIPKHSTSKFVTTAKKLNTNIVLMHQILITITLYFLLAIICVLALIFTAIPIAFVLVAIWMGLFISGMLEVALMLLELFRIILYIASNEK